jgi:hypothetical protein
MLAEGADPAGQRDEDLCGAFQALLRTTNLDVPPRVSGAGAAGPPDAAQAGAETFRVA